VRGALKFQARAVHQSLQANLESLARAGNISLALQDLTGKMSGKITPSIYGGNSSRRMLFGD
jgi:hypothetical protein